MSERVKEEAYVTLATNDSYAVGALVVGESLRSTETRRKLVVMVSLHVTQPMRDQLSQVFDELVQVDVLDSEDAVNLELLGRPDLGLTFTKLRCWKLTHYKKCVFLDADTLVLQNIDDLFDCDELAAAPDVGWPDCFNSGVFVFCPSEQTYSSLLSFALTHGSFDGGDQGLLNMYFSDWSKQGRNRRLPFTYNTVAQAFYSYAPAFKQFGHDVKVVHFIGATKPWQVSFNEATRRADEGPGHATEFLHMWWSVYLDRVHHRLSEDLKSSLGDSARLGDVTYSPSVGKFVDDSHRQYSWERGEIDYLGKDSFDNILRQLESKIDTANGVHSSQAGVEVQHPLQAAGQPETRVEAVKQTSVPAARQPAQADQNTKPVSPIEPATLAEKQQTSQAVAQQPLTKAIEPTVAQAAAQQTAAQPSAEPEVVKSVASRQTAPTTPAAPGIISIDPYSPAAPQKPPHRKILRISARAYREHVGEPEPVTQVQEARKAAPITTSSKPSASPSAAQPSAAQPASRTEGSQPAAQPPAAQPSDVVGKSTATTAASLKDGPASATGTISGTQAESAFTKTTVTEPTKSPDIQLVSSVTGSTAGTDRGLDKSADSKTFASAEIDVLQTFSSTAQQPQAVPQSSASVALETPEAGEAQVTSQAASQSSHSSTTQQQKSSASGGGSKKSGGKRGKK